MFKLIIYLCSCIFLIYFGIYNFKNIDKTNILRHMYIPVQHVILTK
jgi:hypothetical protein